MKYLALLISGMLLFACSTEEESGKKNAPDPEVLVETDGNMFIEYYPGKKQVKFKGPQDENKQRHGVWYYYSEAGVELSMTEYNHGKKNGVTMVKYPNGFMHYTGQYREDVQVGVWKTYDTNGKLVEEKNFDELNQQ